MISRFIFSFIAVFALGLFAQAQEVKPKWDKQLAIDFLEAQAPLSTAKYPPYPDVWWRETPVIHKGKNITAITGLETNDPIFRSFWSLDDDLTMGKSQYQEFFSGRTWQASTPEGGDIIDSQHFGHPPIITETAFSDGSTLEFLKIERYSNITPFDDLMDCHFGPGLMRKDKNGTVLWRRVMVQINKTPIKNKYYRRYCHAVVEGGGESPHYSITSHTRANFWQFDDMYMVMLKDDTFLAVPSGAHEGTYPDPYVIRFDRDLRSPFFADNDEFYILDIEELFPLLEKAKRYTKKHHRNAFEYFDGLLIDYLTTRKGPAPISMTKPSAD